MLSLLSVTDSDLAVWEKNLWLVKLASKTLDRKALLPHLLPPVFASFPSREFPEELFDCGNNYGELEKKLRK